MSQRHEDPVLDAAKACVLAVGVRRTTMTDVARRAGVSRMTLYRRFPDVTSIIQELMTREFAELIEQGRATTGADERERMVRSALDGVRALAAHPLFERLLDVDPELLLPYFTSRVGTFQAMLREAMAAQIAAGIAEGSIREGDPAVMAGTLELALRGYVFAARAEDPARDLDELARLIDGWLRP
jgi:AcrR family transcriptional regulator